MVTFSQIVLAGSSPGVADRVVGVTAPGADVLFSLNQIADSVSGLIAAFTSSRSGLVPASGGGSSNFLRADGTWAPAGGGGGGSGVTSFNSRTGIVVPQSGDYAFTNISGNISTSQMNSGTSASSSTFWRGDGTWATPAGGGGTPGGANTNVQFNSSSAFGGDAGFTYAGSGQATLALGTITANAKALNITGTWNNAAVTFDAPLFMNITNTASTAGTATVLGSSFIDIQNGGTTTFAVYGTGDPRLWFARAGGDATAVTITGGAGIFTFTRIDIGAVGWIGSFSGTVGIHTSSTLSLGWSSGTGTAQARLWSEGSNLISQANSSTAQTFRVYNTTDINNSSPTNYERGVFDWTTTANTLTIGTQAGGTGTARTLVLISAATAIGIGGSTAAFPGIRNEGGGTLAIVAANNSAYANLIANSFTANTSLTVGANVYLSNNSGLVQIGTAADPSLGRAASNVLEINNGTLHTLTGTYLNWGGEARVTSDFSVTSSVTLVNVTGLTVNVAAGRTYNFQTELYVTDAAAGGVQAAIAGTATATAIQYTGYTVADNAIKGKTNATALAVAVGSTVTTETSGIVVRITGIITVNAAGTLTVQMAQNTSNGTATIAKRGSYLIVQDMP